LLIFMMLGGCPDWLHAQEQAPAQQPPAPAPPYTPPPHRRVDPFKQFERLRPLPTPFVPAEQVWRLTLGVPPSAGGAMDDERIYIPMRDALLVSLERETGRLQWIRQINTTQPPVVADGMVFVADVGAIRALDAVTGQDRWRQPLAAAVTAPLTFDTGWLIAIVDPGEIVAMRAADGAVIWRRALGAVSAHPAVPGGEAALILSLGDGRVVALSLSDGAPLWEQKLPGMLCEPAVARDRVFVGSTDNFFYALDDDSGEIEWKWQGGGDVIGAAADGDVVYYASLDNIVRAVNRGNGNQRWRKATGTRPILPPRAFGGVVLVPGISPAVAAFVARTGDVMGTYIASGHLIGAPLIDSAAKPFKVSLVTITREGVVEALRSTGLNFREAVATPFTQLPGRPVARERLPE
jgi:outer membrane protein assembly factor BamB